MEANRRDSIVQVAQQLFYHRGYHACSMGEIAEAAGVYKGNLSYYFKTKADLLAAVTDNRLSRLQAHLAHIQKSADSPKGALVGFIEMVAFSAADLVRYGCPMGSLNIELGKKEPALQLQTRVLLQACEAWLADRFAERLPAAEARRSAEQLLVMAQGTAVMAQSLGDTDLVARQCRQMQEWLNRTGL